MYAKFNSLSNGTTPDTKTRSPDAPPAKTRENPAKTQNFAQVFGFYRQSTEFWLVEHEGVEFRFRNFAH